MKLLEGKKISDKILGNLKKKIKAHKIKPGLAVILIGENKASETYVRLKEKAARKVDINFYKFKFKKNIPEKEIIAKIRALNADKKVDGIIVQLPLPKKFQTQKIINLISLRKDVDGFSTKKNNLNLQPVFPSAIMKILISSQVNLKNKKAVVIANSKKFGETMQKILAEKKIKSEYILSGEIKQKINKIQKVDIIISAVGKTNLIKGEMIKRGAIVVDGGIVKKNGKTFGDADFQSVSKKVAFISPVPGGVGPVTIACLLENVYLASKK
jgi:methylenetetrahydrofolate dehydrogenase (NADP+)/methenyltetrahydrofolate cyclohydrolase